MNAISYSKRSMSSLQLSGKMHTLSLKRSANLVPTLDVLDMDFVAVHLLVPKSLLALDEGCKMHAVVIPHESINRAIVPHSFLFAS